MYVKAPWLSMLMGNKKQLGVTVFVVFSHEGKEIVHVG